MLETSCRSEEQKKVVKATAVTKINIYNAMDPWLALELPRQRRNLDIQQL